MALQTSHAKLWFILFYQNINDFIILTLLYWHAQKPTGKRDKRIIQSPITFNDRYWICVSAYVRVRMHAFSTSSRTPVPWTSRSVSRIAKQKVETQKVAAGSNVCVTLFFSWFLPTDRPFEFGFIYLFWSYTTLYIKDTLVVKCIQPALWGVPSVV